MPNPDGTMTPAERQKALLAIAPTPNGGNDMNHLNKVHDGTGLYGGYGTSDMLDVQNELFGNLTDAQAIVKRQGDFGLGSNNNAQASAMLGNAGATADKYSGQFASDAQRAQAASIAAGDRSYNSDMGAYSAGIGDATQDRNNQLDSYGALKAFAAGPQGPSAAQAQLQQATVANQAQLAQTTNANTENALAMARSGRGMGGSQAALRGAVAQNATTQQAANVQSATNQQLANSQMSELRANENTAFQTQRLNALNAAGGLANNLQGSDLARATGGLAGTQYQTDTKLKGTQLNDATSQAWAAQQQGAQQQGLGAEMGGQTQQLNIDTSALAGRESEWASANQSHGIDTGNATQAGIADANRTQAYVGAGASAAGGVIAAVSDERAKTDIQPLTTNQPASAPVAPVAPLPSQAPAASTAPLASKSAADAAQRSATGGAVGGAAGSVAGGVIGSVAGPVGSVVGSVVGNVAGKALGKVFSDVRNKKDIQPLTALSEGLSAGGSYLKSGPSKDAFGDLQAIAAKYGAGGVAQGPKQAKEYTAIPTARFADVKGDAPGIFSRSTDHPILSKGDALLADSARNAPPSAYQYKDPKDGQGTFVGPMAQDLAKNPVTAPAVDAGPDGKLSVDGPRAALAALSQNSSQQNQLDALYAMLDDSKKRELQRSSGGLDSAGNPFLSAGAR